MENGDDGIKLFSWELIGWHVVALSGGASVAQRLVLREEQQNDGRQLGDGVSAITIQT